MRVIKPSPRRRSVVPVSLLLVLTLGVTSFGYVSGRYKNVKRSPTCATLKYGAKGPAVARIQSYVGARPDGDFGPLTAAAVRKWQRHHHVKPTVVFGPATWAAFPRAVPRAAVGRQRP